jgi:hypothetical protein
LRGDGEESDAISLAAFDEYIRDKARPAECESSNGRRRGISVAMWATVFACMVLVLLLPFGTDNDGGVAAGTLPFQIPDFGSVWRKGRGRGAGEDRLMYVK